MVKGEEERRDERDKSISDEAAFITEQSDR
jgi:hypothetical protein